MGRLSEHFPSVSSPCQKFSLASDFGPDHKGKKESISCLTLVKPWELSIIDSNSCNFTKNTNYVYGKVEQ